VRFFYAAPDRLRSELRGRAGILQVADGTHLHTCFARGWHPGGRPRYTSMPISDTSFLPHFFNPQWPVQAEAYLFARIGEQAVSAEIQRHEDGCAVVAVEYEQQPDQGFAVHESPVLFWIDDRHRMVVRHQGKMGHRAPTEEEITWSRHTMVVREMRVNEPIPDEVFHFTPAEDAESDTSRATCGVGAWGGGGFRSDDPDPNRRFEHQHSAGWEGDMLVDRSQWKIRGMKLAFERHCRFSDDGTGLEITDNASGPKGEVQTNCKLPIA